MKKLFLMAAFAAFAVAGNAQTASTTEATPAPAKKACCSSNEQIFLRFNEQKQSARKQCQKANVQKVQQQLATAKKQLKLLWHLKRTKKAVATTNKP